MWILVGLLGVGAAGAVLDSKTDPVQWIAAGFLATVFLIVGWQMIKHPPAPRLKINLKDELGRIEPDPETNCAICARPFIIGERCVCSGCGVEKAALTV
ncbi:MAG TPA: hypothetical protein VI488_00540 [Candidatus Angelobacter sp.]